MSNEQSIQAYYEERYRDEKADAFPRDPARYAEWLGSLRSIPANSARALDFGCGVGFVCSELLDRGFEVVGVEVAQAAVTAAEQREPRGHFLVVDSGTPMPFPDASFDVVTCFGVIEHVPEPGPTIAELRRVATDEAEGIWVVPNAWSPLFWFGRGTEQIEETPRSLAEWTRLLAAHGWEVTTVRRDPGPVDRPVANWKRGVQRLLNYLPLCFTYQFVLVTRPLP